MIFATDLDRTLIFSKKNFNYNSEKHIFIDYNRLGQPISYIEKETLNNLKNIKRKDIEFIPVTARTDYKYNRLLFKELKLDVETYIYNNGVDIVYKGKRLREWDNYVYSVKSETDMERIYRELINNLKAKVSFLTSGVLIKSKVTKEIKEIINYIEGKFNVEYSFDTEFCQILYKNLNKVNSLKFLLEKCYKKEVLITAGDSKNDLEMLKIGDKGFGLSTGNIIENIDEVISNNIEIIGDNTSKASIILTKKVLKMSLEGDKKNE